MQSSRAVSCGTLATASRSFPVCPMCDSRSCSSSIREHSRWPSIFGATDWAPFFFERPRQGAGGGRSYRDGPLARSRCGTRHTGRIIDPLGNPLDEGPPVLGGERLPLFRPTPGDHRAPQGRSDSVDGGLGHRRCHSRSDVDSANSLSATATSVRRLWPSTSWPPNVQATSCASTSLLDSPCCAFSPCGTRLNEPAAFPIQRYRRGSLLGQSRSAILGSIRGRLGCRIVS